MFDKGDVVACGNMSTQPCTREARNIENNTHTVQSQQSVILHCSASMTKLNCDKQRCNRPEPAVKHYNKPRFPPERRNLFTAAQSDVLPLSHICRWRMCTPRPLNNIFFMLNVLSAFLLFSCCPSLLGLWSTYQCCHSIHSSKTAGMSGTEGEAMLRHVKRRKLGKPRRKSQLTFMVRWLSYISIPTTLWLSFLTGL